MTIAVSGRRCRDYSWTPGNHSAAEAKVRGVVLLRGELTMNRDPRRPRVPIWAWVLLGVVVSLTFILGSIAWMYQQVYGNIMNQ